MKADAALSHQDFEARIDKLTQALFHLAGELWVMRDRQIILERVLAEAGIEAPALIDAYRPEGVLTQGLNAEREAFVSRIVAILAPDA